MEQKGAIFTRRASGLVRELSWVDVFIFVIPGPAASGITYFSVARATDRRVSVYLKRCCTAFS